MRNPVPTRRRLDTEMVRRGLAASRTEAQRIIDSGSVTVAGRPLARPATLVSDAEAIELESVPRWASRAGFKLDQALDDLALDVEGRTALDVGASTGGFTDVLLARGVGSVTAVDVGYGQMVTRLSRDPRVRVMDRVNFRTVDLEMLGGPFDLIVVDVSFISVGLLASNLAAVGTEGSDYVILVKPQFELERDAVGKGGIVKDAASHAKAIQSVAGSLAEVGIAPLECVASRVAGLHGNREFFVQGSLGGEALDPAALAVRATA
jgi:23S rRNA (cytidine1920-2'-O)/16S rRNA (cytidine1409-2'-O)-methyltransferase